MMGVNKLSLTRGEKSIGYYFNTCHHDNPNIPDGLHPSLRYVAPSGLIVLFSVINNTCAPISLLFVIMYILSIYFKTMKNKINKWGNSHGIRLSGQMLDHLNAENGDQLEIKMTKNGIEIIKNTSATDEVRLLKKQLFADLINQTKPIKKVNDPNIEGQVSYIIIDINPCQPIIREVSKGNKGAYKTLSEAKYAARKMIHKSIEISKSSLADIRQLGVEKIKYIEL